MTAFERAASPRGPLRPHEAGEAHGFIIERKEHHMSNTNRPTHRAYAVLKNGKRTYWHEIGAVWPHQDGDGFNLKLDYLPLNGAEIVIRKPKAAETAPAVTDAE
jgi:hypothetical protein